MRVGTPSVAGKDLGPPQLIDGYANGWLVTPKTSGRDMVITLEWTPQRPRGRCHRVDGRGPAGVPGLGVLAAPPAPGRDRSRVAIVPAGHVPHRSLLGDPRVVVGRSRAGARIPRALLGEQPYRPGTWCRCVVAGGGCHLGRGGTGGGHSRGVATLLAVVSSYGRCCWRSDRWVCSWRGRDGHRRAEQIPLPGRVRMADPFLDGEHPGVAGGRRPRRRRAGAGGADSVVVAGSAPRSRGKATSCSRWGRRRAEDAPER